MNLLGKILRGVAFVPGIVTGIEALFSGKSGSDKKQAALSFLTAALAIGEAVTNHEIADEPMFHDGMGKVIDGVVQCLNASAWAKSK